MDYYYPLYGNLGVEIGFDSLHVLYRLKIGGDLFFLNPDEFEKTSRHASRGELVKMLSCADKNILSAVIKNGKGILDIGHALLRARETDESRIREYVSEADGQP